MASTLTIQEVVDSMRIYPEYEPVMQAAGFTQRPAIDIANDVMQKFLAMGMNWKFNRAGVPSILTVPLQQDYVTSVTNLSWLEQGWRLDINNSMVPKPFFGMESVRDISQTSYQSNPFNLSWVPNSLAIMGKWQANTLYPIAYGRTSALPSPIQQFIDVNGNILYLSNAGLNLTLNTPGVGQSGFVAPTEGTSGGVQPAAPANSLAGVTVVDNTLTWTVADPDGVTIRLGTLPSASGIAWLIFPVYQKKPVKKTSLQDTFTPILDDYSYLIRQGFRAGLAVAAGSKNSNEMYSQWEEALMTTLRSGDREREEASFYPSQGITGQNPWRYGMPVGAAWPFDWFGGGY